MTECGYCGNETRNTKVSEPENLILCNDCRAAKAQYDAMSEEERAADHKRIEEHLAYLEEHHLNI